MSGSVLVPLPHGDRSGIDPSLMASEQLADAASIDFLSVHFKGVGTTSAARLPLSPLPGGLKPRAKVKKAWAAPAKGSSRSKSASSVGVGSKENTNSKRKKRDFGPKEHERTKADHGVSDKRGRPRSPGLVLRRRNSLVSKTAPIPVGVQPTLAELEAALNEARDAAGSSKVKRTVPVRTMARSKSQDLQRQQEAMLKALSRQVGPATVSPVGSRAKSRLGDLWRPGTLTSGVRHDMRRDPVDVDKTQFYYNCPVLRSPVVTTTKLNRGGDGKVVTLNYVITGPVAIKVPRHGAGTHYAGAQRVKGAGIKQKVDVSHLLVTGPRNGYVEYNPVTGQSEPRANATLESAIYNEDPSKDTIKAMQERIKADARQNGGGVNCRIVGGSSQTVFFTDAQRRELAADLLSLSETVGGVKLSSLSRGEANALSLSFVKAGDSVLVCARKQLAIQVFVAAVEWGFNRSLEHFSREVSSGVDANLCPVTYRHTATVEFSNGVKKTYNCGVDIGALVNYDTRYFENVQKEDTPPKLRVGRIQKSKLYVKRGGGKASAGDASAAAAKQVTLGKADDVARALF